jgi:hypothetical protein
MTLFMRYATLVIAALCLASPASAAHGADEYFDERTGATITAVHEPIIFALKHSILAANARDYISLTAAAVDRSGNEFLYLIGYIWSTIDRRGPAQAKAPPQIRLELIADGRPINLIPAAIFPSELTDDLRLAAPGKTYLARVAYPVTLEELRYLSESGHFALTVPGDSPEDDSDEEVYELWRDGRQSLRAFVALVGPLF